MTFAKATLAKIYGFVFVTFALGGAACAADATPGATTAPPEVHTPAASSLAGRMVQTMDTDNNAVVTPKEAHASALLHFEMADSAKDGELSRQDLEAYMQNRPNLIDADKDGIVSKQEYLSAKGPFARLEAPGNNAASEGEFNAMLGQVFACLDKDGDGKLTGHERPLQGLIGDGKAPTGQAATLPPLASLDGNNNGTLDKAEWTKAFRDKFKATDKNGDGQVTPEDMRGVRTPNDQACLKK